MSGEQNCDTKGAWGFDRENMTLNDGRWYLPIFSLDCGDQSPVCIVQAGTKAAVVRLAERVCKAEDGLA